ncbi:unnamed protein product [Brassica oleracea]
MSSGYTVTFFDASDIATQIFTVEIQRDKQLDYLMNGLRHLGPSFSSLDAIRPWICYWILHSIALLGESVDDELENNTIDFLGRCQVMAFQSLLVRVHDMGEMDLRACYLAISIASILNILDDELTRGLGDYILSGLSVAQHAWSKDKDTPPLNSDILGSYANHLEHVHLLHNVVMDRYNKAIEFFHRAV